MNNTNIRSFRKASLSVALAAMSAFAAGAAQPAKSEGIVLEHS